MNACWKLRLPLVESEAICAGNHLWQNRSHVCPGPQRRSCPHSRPSKRVCRMNKWLDEWVAGWRLDSRKRFSVSKGMGHYFPWTIPCTFKVIASTACQRFLALHLWEHGNTDFPALGGTMWWVLAKGFWAEISCVLSKPKHYLLVQDPSDFLFLLLCAHLSVGFLTE